MKRLHVIYHGRVQGVGFRFTVMHIAGGLDLTGWVRNSRDGSVEIISEGAENKLHTFLSQVEDSFASYINSKDIDWLEATGEFPDFRIVH